MKKKRNPAAEIRANRNLAEFFKSLGDPKRIQIIRLLLAHGKLHVLKICEELGSDSQPAISHHLNLLKRVKLVDFERIGKFNHYFISTEGMQNLFAHFAPKNGTDFHQFLFGDTIIRFETTF